MAWRTSVRGVTLCHAAMGAAVGAVSYAAMASSGGPGLWDGRDGAALVVLAAMSSWMAVGAGLSGFILVNIERAGEARQDGRVR